MSTASIMKDMAVGSDIVYRANAVRAVIRVIDASTGKFSDLAYFTLIGISANHGECTAGAIERPIKTAIVDKSPSVSSAAL